MNDIQYLTTMSELKFISSVGENQFLNLTSGIIENKNYLTCISRQIWYKHETGPATAKYCRDVIIRAFTLLEKYSGMKDMDEYVKTIKKYINDAKIGMDHLKQTHGSNNMAFAMFDSISVAIQQKILISDV